MNTLILIIAISSYPGFSTSQMEYKFDSAKKCSEAKTYYESHEFKKSLEVRGSLVKVNAKCW